MINKHDKVTSTEGGICHSTLREQSSKNIKIQHYYIIRLWYKCHNHDNVPYIDKHII